MRKLITIVTCMFLFQLSKGQDSTRHFEFGSTLVTVNSFNTKHYFAPDRPSVEFINGLFFRYSKKRLGLRVLASYTDNSATYATPKGSSDGSSGDMTNKDIRIGIGGQLSLLKRREWLYTFIDLSYRNVFSTGHYYGGLWGSSERFSSTANGFDSFLGIGFKLKTFKHVYLSPEMGYFISSKFVNKKTNDLYLSQSSTYKYSEVNLNLAIKLHVTVKF